MISRNALSATCALVAALVAAGPASAQLCNGAASFANGPIRVGAGADFTDGSKAVGAQLAFGAKQGAFANVGLSAVNYDGVDERGTVVNVNGGYSMSLSKPGKAEFCPLVGFAWQSGPNVVTNFGTADVSARAFGFGGSIGGIVNSTPEFDFVPFASVSYFTSKGTISFNGTSQTSTQDYGEIGLGAGFVVNKVLTIRPAVTFPIGLDNGDPSYGIAFAYNFGSPARSVTPRR